ncbi:helix-turn-helix domain-containing protein [Streptomyces sp. NPDC049555]|uniref:helix-turn-helix domain-containing protein n=1 Tax=unclassified Streptomyces TaxID=2593676 RepID=UPI00342F4414
MNEALRRAMAQTRLTDRQLAERCGVDVKTVGRWITQAGRVPHARHRWAVCEAVGEDETREREEGVALTLSTRIRVTLAELEKIKEQAGIDARYSDGHAYLSVFRFDDDMIVTPLLTHHVGHDAPTLHLRRHQDDGMFDRFASHVEELWKRGTPVWEGDRDG